LPLGGRDCECRRATGDARADWGQRLTSIASLLTVVVAVAALLYSNASTRRQLDIAERGQVTDRFAKSIELLGRRGSGNLDVRVGAIYALERIMRDSPADRIAVLQVLSAFVRAHARRTSSRPAPVPTNEAREATQPADVQAALTTLGRRWPPTQDDELMIDISDTSLQGADLEDAILPGVGLVRADLSDSYGSRANLENAALDWVVLNRAHLSGANLNAAMMFRGSLVEADLGGADLRHAHMAEADLRRASLAGADLRDADLSRANLSRAQLTGAQLTGADLHDADLRGADLFAAVVGQHQIQCAVVDRRTKLPAGITRPPGNARFRDPVCTGVPAVSPPRAAVKVSVTVTALDDTYDGPCPPPRNATSYKAEVRVSSGPVDVALRWATSNGGSSDVSAGVLSFPKDGPQAATVFHNESFYVPDQTVTDWVEAIVLSPVEQRSNRALVKITCTDS